MLNLRGCLVLGAFTGIRVRRVQPPHGGLTLKMAKGGHPCSWEPNFASEGDLDGHPRVNALACIWLGCLFSLLLPPASASRAARKEPLWRAQRDAGHLLPAVHPHGLPSCSIFPMDHPWRDLGISVPTGCPI